jgi:hypothetical protein
MSSFDRLNGYLNAKVEAEECRIPGDHLGSTAYVCDFAIYPSDRYLPRLNRNIDQGSCYG